PPLYIGLKPTLPAYLNPSVKPVDLLTGVSFASTEGGLDDGTAMMSLTLTMDKQWSYFEEAVRKMKSLVGDSETNRVIKNALFVISAGTNDMIYNVYDHVLGRFISVSDYQDYTQQNRSVYPVLFFLRYFINTTENDKKKIGNLINETINPKCPSHPHHRICTENQNADSQLYNQKLQKLNFRLSQRLSGSKILYLDIYTPLIDMIKHPHSYGLEETLVGCCGTGLLEAGPLCKPLSRTCEDVSKYMFFDSVHPSQKAYSVIATYAFKKLFPLL
ncbi:hypothetical protein Bca52824_044811, partial [Brassica carinata]